jgi:hypothetical protein
MALFDLFVIFYELADHLDFQFKKRIEENENEFGNGDAIDHQHAQRVIE